MPTRRSVLAASAAAVIARGASDRLQLAVIGTGRRGRYVGGIFAKDARVRVAAISDLYPDQIDAAKTEVPGAAQATVYRDYRTLLAAPDIDAVYIATPPWLHPEHFEAAVRARKHIYCEKPAAADAAGVARVERAAAGADPAKHIAFGLQRRFAPHYQAAQQAIAGGQIGPLLYMKSNWVSWGVLAKPFAANPAWSAEEGRMRMWPHFKATSGDFIVEQDCHGLDVLNWFAGAHPVSAAGQKGEGRRRHGDNSDWFHITYSYPGGLTGLLVGTQISQARFSDVKEQFMGLEGTVETHLNWWRLHQGPGKVQHTDAKYDVTEDAVRNFVDRVLAGKPRNGTQIACESTYTALLGRRAAELGRSVTWDELVSEARRTA